ncbi:MAG: hypothetical protein E6614_33270 [Bradyrhizobium sp.]|jgi:hypothetical protein|nr:MULTISPECIES: hypothetical protein [Bradyrhizobium]MDU0956883.1 hypothetical protein [Bradyrhizobium sp.]MDU1496496.1 hypothetical protein [Bradyrhizobium sp.]MDU1546779.1 hypothetical protein [Bradyrhizobium sp.]MDU1671175.1 hypothetical protein [Bradyrhizobium sp.]MDU1694664.1 hypothetical protein [Bradyrhizobium sp.]
MPRWGTLSSAKARADATKKRTEKLQSQGKAEACFGYYVKGGVINL